MNKLLLLLLLFILSGLVYISENPEDVINENEINIDSGNYKSGLLKSEYANFVNTADYNINVSFDETTHIITVDENILWRNTTKFTISELQFHLYPNAYKSNKTLFAAMYPISKNTQTEIIFDKVEINDRPSHLIYFQSEIQNPYDSTAAKILLESNLNTGDSVNIHFKYSMKIPISVKRMGAARGRNFYFVSQWFPKLGVFENGEWVCSQYQAYTNYYSDFGTYDVTINVPQNYTVGATGTLKSEKEDGRRKTFNFSQAGVHDFAWFTSDNILEKNKLFTRKNGTKIKVTAFIEPESESYTQRYFEAVFNSLHYFEEHIGSYPYETVTLVDVPRTSASGGMEYPTLFNVSAELFSPISTHQPEAVTVHEFSHQYFYGIIANNEVYEAWLDEGFTSYIETKIVHHYYGDRTSSFKLAKFIPIFGLNFLSYNEIPIIYTLGNIKEPEGTSALRRYYYNKRIGTIADTSYSLPTSLSYLVNAYSKPELMLLTLERYLGYEKMMNILRQYYDEFKFKHPTGSDFIKIVQRYTKENISWFFENYYSTARVFDYKVKYVRKIRPEIYEMFVERLGDGIFKSDVALITDKDTLIQKWDGSERWKRFYFHTKDEVIAGQIDPARKNMLDINFANNSYTVEPRYWGSLSLATRWFFWIQNALMILGSIG